VVSFCKASTIVRTGLGSYEHATLATYGSENHAAAGDSLWMLPQVLCTAACAAHFQLHLQITMSPGTSGDIFIDLYSIPVFFSIYAERVQLCLS
jgi:hypothetical protein